MQDFFSEGGGFNEKPHSPLRYRNWCTSPIDVQAGLSLYSDDSKSKLASDYSTTASGSSQAGRPPPVELPEDFP